LKRILLAEAHGPTRDLVGRLLADAGYEVLLAESAASGYEVFAAVRPVAAVVGADLPPHQGRHLAQRLREADARLLLLVADKGHLGRARGVQSVLDLHPNAYVADPTSRELLERLERLIVQSESARAPPDAVPHGIDAVLARPAVDHGDVRPGVLPRVLHQLWRVSADGVLIVQQREVTRRAFLLRGSPVELDSDARNESLGRWLVETGRLQEEQYVASLEAMVSGDLSAGAALVAAGAVEPGDPLYATLRAHLRAMVARLAALREGHWRFHAGAEFVSDVQALEIPPLAPILEGARAGLPVRHFAEALKPTLQAFPARTADFQRLLPAMALSSADLRLALSIDGRSTARAWLEARQDGLKDAYALLWFLSLTGAAAFHPSPAETSDALLYGDAPRPARRKKALPEETAEALRQAALQILPGSYFKALGVDIAAGIEEVERAFHEVASRFHPDSFAEHDMGGLDDLLAQVQDKVNAAYRVLANEEKRRAYLAHLLSRHAVESGRRKPDIVPEAEISLKRGERALRQRRFAEAVAAFRDAAERNPREPEYLAMQAFATLKDPALAPKDRPRAAARIARRALSLDPACVRAIVSLALAEEAEGRVSDARKRLLAALKLAPGNEVAKRALQRVNRVRT
jgi:DNA-binding response OmpR family regulator/tetratricopeptide (TPR) repeat protein